MTESIEQARLPSFDGTGVLARARDLLAGFEAGSAVALLHAACSSPTARQAMASCTALLMSAWMSPPAGSRVATADDLAPLVEALRTDCPNLETVEDFLPLDPRFRVSFRAALGDEAVAFRVHPGGLESPLDVLQGIVNYAEALDPVLHTQLGFGLADLLRLAGRLLDAEMSVLAPAWNDLDVSLETPPSVSEAEVAAAESYLHQWRSDEAPPAWLLESADGPDDERLQLAAGSALTDSQRLSLDAGLHVGPTMFVNGPAGVLPVPAALIIESLTALASAALGFLSWQGRARASDSPEDETASERSEDDPGVSTEQVADAARRWKSRADSDLELVCRAIPVTVLFGYIDNSSDELLLIVPGHRHVVAVALVTGLSSQEVAEGVAAARERLARFNPGSGFRITPQRSRVTESGSEPSGFRPDGAADGDLSWFAGTADAIPFAESLLTGEPAPLADGTAVTRLVVVDGPWQHGPHWVPEIPACTLDELKSLLAAQNWRSTDLEELWAFLDELTSLGADGGNGYAEVVCWSILDAWEAWEARSMLCPAWVDPRTCGFIAPRDLASSWARDAFFDGVDAVLASLGMTGTRGWAQLIPTLVPVAQPGSGEQVVVVTLALYQPRRIWWVAPDMGLVVRADLEFRDDLTFSRAAAGMIANTIEDTLREVARNDPDAWDLWRQAHGEQPALIQVVPGQLQKDMPALRFVGLWEGADLVVADLERLAGHSPAGIHAMIGDALEFCMLAHLQPIPNPGDSSEGADDEPAHAVQGSGLADPDGDAGHGRVIRLNPTEEDVQAAGAFKAAWQAIRPRFSQRANLGPFQPYALTSAQTLSESGQKRAMRTMARRLRSRLDPDVHSLRVVLDDLCPGTLQALSDAARQYGPRAALAAACAELERALSDRLASRASLEMSLSSPWADETLSELDVRATSDDTRRSRVAEMLVEGLIFDPPTGSLIPDRRDIHQLLDLASAALEASHEAQYAYAAIQPAALNVSEFGDVDIERTGTARVDDRAWQQARLEEEAHAFNAEKSHPYLADAPDEAELSDLGDGELGAEESIRSINERDAREGSGFRALNAAGLLNVDDQLLEHSGFGLDAVAAVLAAAVTWDVPAEPRPPVAQVSRDFFVETVTAQSGIPKEQIDAAVAALTLGAGKIRQEGLRYWQLRERSARLALRPLIVPPGGENDGALWILPRCAHRTQHLLLAYLNDQQLPWPDKELPARIRQAVREWHKLAEDQLEKELAAAARSAGLIGRENLTKQKAAREGLALHGEIDLIAVDPQRRRIWIIEAKHLRRIFSPLEMAFRVANFHGPGALATGPDTNDFRQFRSRKFRPYVQRVTANSRAVEGDKQAVARLINAVTPGQPINEDAVADWDVMPVMVTSQVEVAAFVPHAAIPFVLIDHLEELLMTEAAPDPGWWHSSYKSRIDS